MHELLNDFVNIHHMHFNEDDSYFCYHSFAVKMDIPYPDFALHQVHGLNLTFKVDNYYTVDKVVLSYFVNHGWEDLILP